MAPRSTISKKAAKQIGDCRFHPKDSRTQTYRCESYFPKSFHFTIDESAFRTDGENSWLRNIAWCCNRSSRVGKQSQMPSDGFLKLTANKWSEEPVQPDRWK